MEENENVENEETVDGTENGVQQTTPKTYTQEDVDALRKDINEKNQKAWDKRWGQEKSKMERDFARKTEKQDELINLFMSQTGAKTIDDLADMSYKQYGVERPEPKNSSKDDEILGKYDAKEILELDDDSIKDEVERLNGLKRTVREEATYQELGAYLSNKKQEEKIKNEIKENGLDESILEDTDFNEFQKKFNKETPFIEVYNLYQRINPTKQKPYNAGSLKDKAFKNESEFFTQEEFMSLTSEDLKNPKIYEKAMRSRYNFK